MSRDIFLILVFTLLTLTAWVVFEIYHAGSKLYITQDVRDLARPLDPTLSIKTLEALKKREP
ncbi:hypothetical protein A3A70_00580 [candidate division WWE3 bacterium RIFCSPLOWO2_01_FULL_42_11]|uniref:Uncharacterized protein n=1 Tax=candidate division WWE3 bacterium RIFCSPLOWO2_01_FULL_42_11 TaxID=1802627 RepID=A0A1F4VLY7_UNCKA|nr:MAG: hypothetical protein A3A70_00580 [candidate division WWE3 bacterium RIFCSPLOWO2_01_FULL_42_11]